MLESRGPRIIILLPKKRIFDGEEREKAATMVGGATAAVVVALLLMPLMCNSFVVPAGDILLQSSRMTSLRMGLLDNMLKTSPSSSTSTDSLEILDEIGSGSYGTVHLAKLVSRVDNKEKYAVAKRAWTLPELEEKAKGTMQERELKELAERCEYYLDVERHCLAKLADVVEGDDNEENSLVPKLLGVYPHEEEGGDWLVFDLVEQSSAAGGTGAGMPATTLEDVIELDWADQHKQDEADPNAHHHLYVLQKELGMDESSTFADVLDVTLLQLLTTVSHVNNAKIVHRDVKPGNLLVKEGGFVLIDFGSAADLDPPSKTSAFDLVQRRRGFGRVGFEDGRVALSPVYGAPEVYVKLHRSPTNFDSFSSALVFLQLLFNLLDERSDASFRGQLEDVNYDLDSWLERELKEELQPDGIEDAVTYLASRPGLFAVLRGMLIADPERRLSTSDALGNVEDLLAAVEVGGEVKGGKDADGKFFAGVVEEFEQCELPDSGSAIGVLPLKEGVAAATSLPSTAEQALVIPRPLHYVATFSRSLSLGLILSEVDPDGKYEDELSEEDAKLWEDATVDAQPGEVFIRGVAEGGQAEAIGVFEVGDRVMGVGEFHFNNEGFDTVVEMLQRQPVLAKTVTLHFDRKSRGRSHAYERAAPHLGKVVGQGAWSACGRRKTQEDRFVLEEIADGNNAALLAGVFDGHGGNAASTSLAQLLPSLFSVELAGILTDGKEKAASADLHKAMESAYDMACRTYRDGCDELDTCIADYDPREGIILAAMGAKDVIAGSTATAALLSVSEDGADELSVLNCGDSRTLVVGKPRGGSSSDSVVHFSTRDHSPSCEMEIERLSLGKDKGYSQPKCSMGRWRIKVGDFQYGLARSLEGSFTTSKGIVSDPDVSIVNLSEMLAERELACIILASDGLFEVIDNEEAGRNTIKCREEGLEANLAAKQLCMKAIDKGSPDNVSVVVVYLD